MDKLVSIAAFEKIADSGSFSLAGEQLDLTASVVGKAVGNANV